MWSIPVLSVRFCVRFSGIAIAAQNAAAQDLIAYPETGETLLATECVIEVLL